MKIIAFTGAGISKSAGIPTFEEVDGLKKKLSVDFKESHPQEFEDAINQLKNSVKDKEPTIAHKALADLQIPIITMNIDCLHKKAGSRICYQIHGNYKSDNIVLYGQEILFREESINLIVHTAREAKKFGEEAMFLVIGTSMQTAFANTLVWVAEQEAMEIRFINKNADVEVPKVLKECAFLKV
jgi:NAD-dependent deacetylase